MGRNRNRNRQNRNAQFERMKVEEDWKTDEEPALANVGTVFGSSEELADMPPIQDLRRMLPSKRFHVLVKLQQMARVAPSLNNIGDDVEKLAPVIEQMERIILGLAVNPKAMEKWIIAGDDPEIRLIKAFEAIADKLGK